MYSGLRHLVVGLRFSNTVPTAKFQCAGVVNLLGSPITLASAEIFNQHQIAVGA